MADSIFSSPIDIGLPGTPSSAIPLELYDEFSQLYAALRILQQQLGNFIGLGPLDPNNFINNYTSFSDSIQSGRLNAIVVVANADLIAGEIVNLFSSGGVIQARPANGSAIATRAWGWSPNAIAHSASGIIFLGEGYSPSSGLTVGATYYLSSTTPGGITTTAPSIAGTIKQEVGLALSAVDLYIRLSTPIVN